MIERYNLLASIASTTADYRIGDHAEPNPKHVERWIEQFNAEVQLPILREMDYVLKQTYFSQERIINFLKEVLQNEKLAGMDPCAFWKRVKFLDIQSSGASQTLMLALLSVLLKAKCGFEVLDCGKDAEVFVYIDDAAFSGNRVKHDIEKWVATNAPTKAKVHIVMIAMHTGARQYAEQYTKGNIQKAAKDAGKDIVFEWWCKLSLENRKIHADSSDVLWPVSIPNDTAVAKYVEAMNHKPHLRVPGQNGVKGVFSSDKARQLLEEQFLKAGVRIRQMCPTLIQNQRPLGNTLLETLGFGSLIVTFRNCPNNAPLALWAGHPWYPLFPRTTNNNTSMNLFPDHTGTG